MNITVSVDASHVERMLERIGGRTLLTSAVMDAAAQGARMVAGIPRDTGELAGSIIATQGRSPSPNSALIVADSEHGRFVFGGTRYMLAQRPTFDAGATARILAENVARELLG